MKVIVETDKKELFKSGNIVVSPNGHIILVSGAGNTDTSFSGVTLSSEMPYQTGNYNSSWDKKQFTQFSGTITIEL